MTLSIIVPVYKRVYELEKFLRRLESQTDQNFELILVVDTTTEDPLSIIDKHFQKSKLDRKKLKVFFNAKRVGRSKALDQGIRCATSEYTIIVNPSDDFDKTMVASIKMAINAREGADIIEFRASVKTPIKFEGKIVKAFDQAVKIADHKEIFAYTYKFDFNKAFRTEVLKKATTFKFNVIVNSRFSLEHTYKTLIIADTYATYDKSFIVSCGEISKNFNPVKEMRQWEALYQFAVQSLDNKYAAEWKFAFSRSIIQFTIKIVKAAKNKQLSAKFESEIKKRLDGLELENNPYIVHPANEEDKQIAVLVSRINGKNK